MVKEKYLPYIEPEKPPEPEKTPEQIRREKLQNFWYYYKIPVCIAAFIVVALIWTIIARVTKVQPDYSVPVVTRETLPTEAYNYLQKQIEEYAEDLNGDEKVKVELLSYELNNEKLMKEDPEKSQIGMLRFAGDCESIVSAFYIIDAYNALFLASEELFGYPDGKDISFENGLKIEDFGIPLKDTGLISEASDYYILLKDLYIVVRSNSGEIVAKHQQDYDNGYEMLQRILKQQKINTAEAQTK